MRPEPLLLRLSNFPGASDACTAFRKPQSDGWEPPYRIQALECRAMVLDARYHCESCMRLAGKSNCERPTSQRKMIKKVAESCDHHISPYPCASQIMEDVLKNPGTLRRHALTCSTPSGVEAALPESPSQSRSMEETVSLRAQA